MKKGKSITLLSIICVLMAAIAVMTFIRFPVGMKNYNGVLGALETDYDVSGGTAYTLTLSEDNVESLTSDNIDEVISILEERMQTLDYDVFSIKALKNVGEAHAEYDIRIEAKAKTNQYGEQNVSLLTSDIDVVASYGELEFYGGAEANPTERILEDIEVIENAYSQEIVTADAIYYQIVAEFTDEGYDELVELMGDASYYFEMRLGDEVLFSGSSAISKENFDGQSLGLQMQYDASDEDTKDEYLAQSKQIALKIKLAGLKFMFDVSDGVAISSPYGENTELVCIIAISALVLISLLILLILYKGFGVISGLSIVLFMLSYLWMLVAVPNVVISIGGIIGMALAIILTVDGMSILGKRITEEFNNNKTVRASFNTGFRRALMPTLSTIGVGVIVCVLALIFGKGILVSFAMTFGIGVVLSAITTLGFSRMFAYLILPLVKNSDKFLQKAREDK